MLIIFVSSMFATLNRYRTVQCFICIGRQICWHVPIYHNALTFRWGWVYFSTSKYVISIVNHFQEVLMQEYTSICLDLPPSTHINENRTNTNINDHSSQLISHYSPLRRDVAQTCSIMVSLHPQATNHLWFPYWCAVSFNDLHFVTKYVGTFPVC